MTNNMSEDDVIRFYLDKSDFLILINHGGNSEFSIYSDNPMWEKRAKQNMVGTRAVISCGEGRIRTYVVTEIKSIGGPKFAPFTSIQGKNKYILKIGEITNCGIE